MSDSILSILILLGLLQLLLWMAIEVDVWLFADVDAKAGGIPLGWLPVITIMVPFFGLAIQLWYFYLRDDILCAGEK